MNHLAAALFAAVIVFSASSVHAQRPAAAEAGAYPTKPVRVIVGLAPGGATDIQARIFSQKLSEDLGRQFVVDNRAGAGGLIAFQTVAKATPDGYTILAATPSFTIAPAFYDQPPYTKANRLRALAVTSSERSRVLPDLPTIAESGIPGFDVTTWHGWLAPKGTPAGIVNRLSTGLARFVTQPETTEKLAADGGEAVASMPAQATAFVATEVVRWRKLVKATGLRVEQ